MNEIIAKQLLKKYGSPLYFYDADWLTERARHIQGAAEQYNCTVRYAVKANPHKDIISTFDLAGIQFDASSDYEARNLIDFGIAADKISLSSQQPPRDMKELLNSGVRFVATSLHQLALVQNSGWKGNIAVRINPGSGSGHNKRTTTGGEEASFGIWHKYLPEILAWQEQSGCTIDRLHIHVGSGADPSIWRDVIVDALRIAADMPSVTTLDIGGGYKVARVPGEQEADLRAILQTFNEQIELFEQQTSRRLDLEIEPGTWLVANGGTLLAEVVDIVDTGRDGYTFLKLNTGMNDILRPSLYGAQHGLEILNDAQDKQDYVVVGHNCESGDLLTPAPGNPEEITARSLNRVAIGDVLAIKGAGAYCASMRASGYNSFPAAGEIFLSLDNE